MRYKFRGKRLDNGEWVSGSLIIDPDTKRYEIWGFDYYTDADGYQRDPFAHQVDPETVGQYTGLQDKNGKEIYEGESVKWFDRPLAWYRDPDKNPGKILTDSIVFKDGSFRTRKYNELLINIVGTRDFNLLEKSECQIIGNRWDNPELLGG